ncbi:MAG: hypothetical protein CMQ45_02065 [Gammaproteobacteria bacterium]|nr:hypothetical protein [Gammaproteobacteria bacterium]
MLKKILKTVAAGLVVLICLGLAGYVATSPERPSPESSSAAWLEPGAYQVGRAEFVFVDNSRPTSKNRGFPAKPQRTFPTTVWFPRQLDAALPLIVHSHGIVSNRTEMAYLAETLASHGYLVAATDFPLTSGSTAGGANARDVVNQPADISFLIDSLLGLRDGKKPFIGSIDESRIGLSGYSLGGLTTYLATYHSAWRDSRIAAALAIAGPSAVFAPRFFETTPIPVLAIAGTSDALIEYSRNAADLTARAPNISVITIESGTHLGFIGLADPAFRFMENPDTLGCTAVIAVLGANPNAAFKTMGAPAYGIDSERDLPGICDYGYGAAAHPGRQQMITEIATLSFFESVFSPEPSRREQARIQLTKHLAADFSEVTFEPALSLRTKLSRGL